MAENIKVGRLCFEKEIIDHKTLNRGTWSSDAYVSSTAEGYKYIIESEDFVYSFLNTQTKKYETVKSKVWIACFYNGKRYLDFDWADTPTEAMKKCSLHYLNRS